MIICQWANGDQLVRQERALIANLAGRRQVLSTAPHLGGYCETLRWIFNYDCSTASPGHYDMKAPTYAGHLAVIATELGLDPNRAAGISTTAQMEHAAILTLSYGDTSVTAVATAGIDVNGGRAGDPAGWHESDGIFVATEGTINILLFISANLSAGALARSLVTCTEAKTAALQELLAPSRYSAGIATGSGTDGTIIVADSESPVLLTEAGKHCKLGELIGRAVIGAVKEALERQTGLNARRQAHVLARMGRFGVTEDAVCSLTAAAGLAQAESVRRLAAIGQDAALVAWTSLYAHILDQLLWGLLQTDDALPVAAGILRQMQFAAADAPVWPNAAVTPGGSVCDSDSSARLAVPRLIDAYRQGLVRRILQPSG
jgi:adenosylcobinamide amidohydrolase